MKVGVDSVEAAILFDTVATRAVLSRGLELFFNNIAGTSYRKLTSLTVPQIELQLLYSPKATKQWLEVARARSSLGFDMYKSPSGWRHDAELQRRFLEAQDATTRRFKNMFGKDVPSGMSSKARQLTALSILNQPSRFF